jgi:hypothetical protein
MVGSPAAERDALGRAPSRSLGWTPRRWLLVVGLSFVTAQLLLVGVDRAPSWDEAIYLSQVTPGAEAMNLAASRARGITFLVVVPLQLGASLELVRLLLATASAAAIAGAFWPWVGVVGAGAPLAAAAFGTGWVALFYGTEVMPNLWAALAGVAAIGFLARRALGSGGRRDLAAAAALFALTALVRPFDAAVLGATGVALVLVAGRDRVRSVAVVAGGLAFGASPWGIEVVTRYGGLGEAFEQATSAGRLAPTSPAEAFVRYLAAVDGPAIGPQAAPVVPPGAFVALVAAIGLTAYGLARTRGSPRAWTLAVVTGGGSVSVVAYVTFVGATAPRFLAPALVLLSIPIGVGLAELWRATATTPAVRAILFVCVASWLVWQGAIAVDVAADARADRAPLDRLGLAIGAIDEDDRPCAVVSVTGYPQVGYPSGCRGRPLPRSGSIAEAVTEEERRGTRTLFIVVDGSLDPIADAPDAAALDLPHPVGLRVYRVELWG